MKDPIWKKNEEGAERIRKTYELKDGVLDGNTIKGVASVTGVVDRGRDVMFPGCYKGVLSSFLKIGFASRGHDWEGDPIIMPTKARENGQNLDVEGEYHSTDDAQKNRTIVSERLAKGLFVGLSVGFMPDYSKICYFEDGDKLLGYAEDNGYQMDLFDTKTIKKEKQFLRGIPVVKELFEWSVVTVPMNQYSQVTELRSFDVTSLSFLQGLDPAALDEDQRKGLEAIRASIDNLLSFKADQEADEDSQGKTEERYRILRARTLSLKNRTVK